jgi:hypothetical protein
MVRQSGFTFEGTVVATGQSTPTVPREDATMVVRVDKVLEALPPLGDAPGLEVTVRGTSAQPMKVGEHAIFFTYLYTAGKTLGLQEVGALPGEAAATDGARARILQARVQIEDQAIAARLRTASLVVLGVVVDPRPADPAHARDSEHDPMWWRAPIKVEAVLAGPAQRAPVIATFASSDDTVWVTAPKLRAGQRGVFLLQPPARLPDGFRADGAFVLDPLDVRPPEEAQRIRGLLKTTR